MRFLNNKAIDETFTRFLSTSEKKSYELYIQLLKDANIIKTSRGISIEHLVRQVMVRSPADIKSLLLQSAQVKVERDLFTRPKTELSVAFPESIINSVEAYQGIEGGINSVTMGGFGGLKTKATIPTKVWYCNYHGKGDHSRKFVRG